MICLQTVDSRVIYLESVDSVSTCQQGSNGFSKTRWTAATTKNGIGLTTLVFKSMHQQSCSMTILIIINLFATWNNVMEKR